MTTEEQERRIREEIDSIDWDAIDDEYRIDAIGSELYEQARSLEEIGYEGSIATIAGIMDGFTAHRLRIGDDAKKVAAGFAKAMVRATANEAAHPEKEQTS